ncbi:MAG: hypothetical protein M4579_005562 [Chaenotheca gracillima]|nr:MAG: hypothetical protein M4579_005562 [Chaenotheca gracillima]
MSQKSASPPSRGGLGSLYADLLEPSTKTTQSAAPSTAASISRAPVVFNRGRPEDGSEEDAALKKQQINSAALRFQPTKRPQIVNQKSKPKSGVPKPTPVPLPADEDRSAQPAIHSTPSRPAIKSTLADWTAVGGDEDVNGFYEGEKRQRGGRKKRKKNRDEPVAVQNWDDIYDPSRPNNYEEYKHSDEKIREVREWKDRLYAHRMARRRSSDLDSEDEDTRRRPPLDSRFAPPPNLSFAPPPVFEAPEQPRPLAPAAAPVPEVQMDQSGEDAFARRMRMSQQQPPVPPPPSSYSYSPQTAAAPEAPAQPVYVQPESRPPPTLPEPQIPNATISRAPVRYNLPTAPSELPKTETELADALRQEEESGDQPAPGPDNEEEAPRSLRPGQKGFAARLMSKYGWTKGTGLGASNTGIVNPLRVQVEKQKKKPDSEGGGVAGPGNRGKILGGQKGKTGAGGAAKDAEEGLFGKMSEVIMLKGMVDGMDLDAEVAGQGEGEGGLMQEIGEECGEKYGRVERVFIDRSTPQTPKVFVKFTSQLSALRAVNALQGRTFNGNVIAARFFDTDRFEQGELE